MLWTKNQEQLINSHIGYYNAENQQLQVWLPQELEISKFTETLAKIGDSELFFSVSLSRANIFFRAPFKGTDSKALLFAVPAKVFKIQRRKDMRLTIPEGHVLKIEYADPLGSQSIQKKALDISAGGCSIVVPAEEEVVYQPGLVLRGVTFTIRNRKITVEGEIRHTLALPDRGTGSGIKLGILFKNITQADASFIQAYVFEETRALLSRFI